MNKQRDFWSRIFTFLPTPTSNDGETIDETRLREEIDFQIENGVDGICVFGSTGGNGSFTDEEMKKTTTLAARHAAGRISVVAGTGARTTSACISLSRHAQDSGCDGIMVLPVSYWPLTPDEVRDHYERVSAAVRLPICIYNNPWTTGMDMKPDFLAQLAKLDNVSCIKESTGDLSRISAIRAILGESVTLIAGWESTSLQAFSAGATGWAPVCTNFAPKLATSFCKSAWGPDADLHAKVLIHLPVEGSMFGAYSQALHLAVSRRKGTPQHSRLQLWGRFSEPPSQAHPLGFERRPLRDTGEQHIGSRFKAARSAYAASTAPIRIRINPCRYPIVAWLPAF